MAEIAKFSFLPNVERILRLG